MQTGRGEHSRQSKGTCKDLGTDQQGRKMRGKEVLPFGQPETTYKRGKRK